MDNRRFFRQAMVLTLAAGLLASCSKDDAGVPDSDDQLIPVSPGIALSTKAPDDPSTSSSPVLNQVVEGLTFSFLRADDNGFGFNIFAFASEPEHITGTCATPYLDEEMQVLVAPIEFNPTQYYPLNGLKTRFWGWYPKTDYAGVNSRGVLVTLDFDGKTDILFASAEDGSGKEPIENFQFEHILTQLQFRVVAESEIAADQWGSVTSISLENEFSQYMMIFSPTELNPPTAQFMGVKTLGAYLFKEEIPIEYENAADAGIIMLEPRTISSSKTINLKVTTTGKGVMNEAINLNDYEDVSGMKFEAGSAYTLTLRFLQDDVEIEVRPANWRLVNVDVEIGGEYPYVKDGKYIISRDLLGSVGDGNFHEAWTSTTVNTDETSVSAAFEVAETDAMVDVNWYVAVGQQEGTANPDTENACPEGWRLPTIKELDLIQAQAEKLDVEKLVSPDGYWSATEAMEDTNQAHIWETGNGLDRQASKTEVGRVRCVRDI